MSFNDLYRDVNMLRQRFNKLARQIGFPIPLCNFTASAAPTVNDDSSAGYGLGSRWVYNGSAWVAVDVTGGAAVWEPSAGGSLADLFVLKAGDTMTGALNINGSANVVQLDLTPNAPQTSTFVEFGTKWAVGANGHTEINPQGYGAIDERFLLRLFDTITATTGVKQAIGGEIRAANTSGTRTADTYGLQFGAVGTGNTQRISGDVIAVQSFSGSGGGSTGQIDDAFAFDGYIQSFGTGLTQNGYGMRIRSVVGSSGTMTNQYGLRIFDQDFATNSYAIYTGLGEVRLGDLVNMTAAVNHAIETVTASTVTLDTTHYTVLCDTSSNAITVNLPAASDASGRVYNIKLIDSTNSVTVDGNSSETIDGATTQVISIQYDSLMIQCDGTEWWII